MTVEDNILGQVIAKCYDGHYKRKTITERGYPVTGEGANAGKRNRERKE